jgi:hypothetical protein
MFAKNSKPHPQKKTLSKLENLTKLEGLLLIGGQNLLTSIKESIKQEVSPHFCHSQF